MSKVGISEIISSLIVSFFIVNFLFVDHDLHNSCNDSIQSCKYYLLRVQRALTALKHVYLVQRSSYLHSVKKFLSYMMWDVINNPYGIDPHIGALIPFVMTRPNYVNIIRFGPKESSRL